MVHVASSALHLSKRFPQRRVVDGLSTRLVTSILFEPIVIFSNFATTFSGNRTWISVKCMKKQKI